MEKLEKKHHILVVDDDTKLRSLLAKFLDTNNFFVTAAKDTTEAREQMKNFAFDLIVLDVMMPDETGTEFAKKLRASNIDLPIIMLTALGEIEDKIEGLESGADDYLPKPFNPKELLLRIKSIIRRTQKLKAIEKLCKFGEFDFNIDNLKLEKNKQSIHLTDTEATILKTFCQNQNQILSREDIAELSSGIDERSVDVQITRLRKKIEAKPKNPEYLQTVRGKGYILKS